jgi:hypothetical protein
VEWKKFRVSDSGKRKGGSEWFGKWKESKVTLCCALEKKTPAWCCRDGVSMIGGWAQAEVKGETDDRWQMG